MNNTTIKHHMERLDKGYRIWTVPLLKLLWDIGWKTDNGNTISNVVKSLLAKPYYLMIAAWVVILSLAMDHRGRLLLATLQDTSDMTATSHIMLEHNRYADLLMITPLVYIACKIGFMYFTGGISTDWWKDAHIVISFIAAWDSYKSVKGNVLIRKELEY